MTANEMTTGNKQVPSEIIEEGAKYFPSESTIKKSILSPSLSRGTKAIRKKKIRERLILSQSSRKVATKRDTNDTYAR